MVRNRRRRAFICGLLFCLVLFGISGVVLVRAYRQERANRLLTVAIKMGNTKAVSALLDAGADANSCERSDTPFTIRQFFGDFLERLRPKARASTAQAPAAPATPALLLLWSGSRCFPDPNNITAPQYNTVIARGLLEHGADIHARDNEGHNALFLAAGESDPEMLQLLLDHGANVNDHEGEPLFYAVTQKRLENAVFLLEHGADASLHHRGSPTPLQWAVITYNDPMAKLLLKHGADVNVTGWGSSAIVMARGRGEDAVVQMLKRAGAKE